MATKIVKKPAKKVTKKSTKKKKVLNPTAEIKIKAVKISKGVVELEVDTQGPKWLVTLALERFLEHPESAEFSPIGAMCMLKLAHRMTKQAKKLRMLVSIFTVLVAYLILKIIFTR